MAYNTAATTANSAMKKGSGYMLQGCLCNYVSFDPDECLVGCKGKGQVLCLTREIACASGHPLTGCGCVTNTDNKEYCKIGCMFCAYGCKQPETCCKGASHTCCIKSVQAFPLEKKNNNSHGDAEQYLSDIVCGQCCLTCSPQLGCCVKAPRCVALEKSVFDYGPVSASSQHMDRGGEIPLSPYLDDPELVIFDESEKIRLEALRMIKLTDDSLSKSTSSYYYITGDTYKGNTEQLEVVKKPTKMLRKGEEVFVKRSTGEWTYAKFIRKSSDYLEFDIGRSTRGTKKYPRKDLPKVARLSKASLGVSAIAASHTSFTSDASSSGASLFF